MKTYVLIVSRYFPKNHKQAEQETMFVEKILNGEKIHTIRSNYDLWEKRLNEVQEGKAILSLRYWSVKPYKSKQVEFLRITHENKAHIQKLVFYANNINCPYIFDENGSNYPVYGIDDIARNDGLSFEDFREWFKNHDFSNPLAIIHFTNFKY